MNNKNPLKKIGIRQIILALFIFLWIINGTTKYIFNPPYNNDSQWDLKTNITSIQTAINQKSPEDNSDHEQILPLHHLPVSFLLFDFIGRLPWKISKFLWFIVSIVLVLHLTKRTVSFTTDEGAILNFFNAGFMGLLIILFKGTYLGLASGQLSLFVIWLLFLFISAQDPGWKLSVLILALSTIKPHLAAPFFIYLIFKKEYKLLIWSTVLVAVSNIFISYFYLGPIQHWTVFYNTVIDFNAIATNDVMLMGASGRTDLAPFLATLGFSLQAIFYIRMLLLVGGLASLYIYRNHFEKKTLLLNINIIFFLCFYHRDYDVLLLLIMSIPFLWTRASQLSIGYILALFPLVLPIQGLFFKGISIFPDFAVLWHLIGTSLIISIVGIGFFFIKTTPFHIQNNKW